jgi:hypothetical protein
MRYRILEAVKPGGTIQAGLVQIGLARGLYDDRQLQCFNAD